MMAILSVGRTERSIRVPPNGHSCMMLKNWTGQTSYGSAHGDAPKQNITHPSDMAPNRMANATWAFAALAAVNEAVGEEASAVVTLERAIQVMRALVITSGKKATTRRPAIGPICMPTRRTGAQKNRCNKRERADTR